MSARRLRAAALSAALSAALGLAALGLAALGFTRAAARSQVLAPADSMLVTPAADSTATRVTGEKLRQVMIDGVPMLVIDRVRIEHGATVITGEVGRYDREAGRAVIDGDVTVVDGPATITGDHGTYDMATDRATLAGKVKIRRDDLEIRGPRADYDRAAGVVRLGGGVTVVDAKRRVDADSLAYWRDDDRAMAFGHVRIDESGEEAKLAGDIAEYKRKEGDLQLLERASVVLEEEGQPVEVTARDLTFRREGSEVVAEGDVVVRQEGATAEAEHALFRRDKHRAILTGNPVARDPHGEVRGDSLDLAFENGKLRRLVARGDARASYRRALPAGDEEVMRLAGRTLTVELEDGTARQVVVEGGAESEYFPGSSREASGALRNLAHADRMRVLMRAGQAERAILEGGAQGEYFYRRAAPDSAGAGADSLAAAGTAGPPDSLAAAAGIPDSLGGGAAAAPDSLVQSIRYQADRIDYLVERNEIILDQHAELFHETLHLTAGHVRFAAGDRTLLATDSPELEDGTQEMKGKVMAYEFNTREGQVMEGTTTFEQGLYSGARLFKSGEGVFDVEGAAYTTCDHVPPHYHFAGQRMKIFLDDKVVTRPLGLFIYRVPILALPYYIFPIKRGRHSGFLLPQVEFGFSESRGRFVRNAGYYWVINDYADLRGWADISEFSPFFIGNLDVRYALRYRLEGDLTTKFTLGEGTRSFDVQGSHRQDLGRGRTLRANVNFLSDREFRRTQQGQLAPDRFSTQLRSNLNYSKNWSSQSVRVSVERTQNLQDVAGQTEQGQGTVTGTFPTVSYSFFNRTVGRAPDSKGRGGRWPFLASTNYSFSSDYRRSFDTRRKPDIYLQGASGQASLADRRRFKMLNFGPSLSLGSSFAERAERSDSAGVLRPVGGTFANGQWSAALELQTEMYGLFAPTLGPFHGFRHILTPRSSLSYSDRFDSRPDVEGGRPSSTVSLSVANRLETRLPAGEKLRPVRDFLTLNLSSTYDLSNRSAHRFTPVLARARLRPGVGRDFEIDYGLTYDPYRRRPTRYDTSTRFTFVRAGRAAGGGEGSPAGAGGGAGAGEAGSYGEEEVLGGGAGAEVPGAGGGAGAGSGAVAPADLFPRAFTVGGTLSFAGGGADQTLQAAIQASARLTPAWQIDYNLRYDLIDRQVVGQNYTLIRDLHCWQAQFRRSFDTGRWEYYFRIAIKDLPQIFYERGRERFGVPRLF